MSDDRYLTELMKEQLSNWQDIKYSSKRICYRECQQHCNCYSNLNVLEFLPKNLVVVGANEYNYEIELYAKTLYGEYYVFRIPKFNYFTCVKGEEFSEVNIYKILELPDIKYYPKENNYPIDIFPFNPKCDYVLTKTSRKLGKYFYLNLAYFTKKLITKSAI